MPSDVADRMIATSSGLMITSVLPSGSVRARPISNDATKPTSPSERPAAQHAEVELEPGEEQQERHAELRAR